MSDNVGNKPPRGFVERLESGTTISASQYREGTDFTYPDQDHSTTGIALPRSGRRVTMRLVRNSSGIALLPKRLVKYETGREGERVDGYCAVGDEKCAGFVDEALPSSGAPDDSLFLIAVKGPALGLTDLAGGAENVISAGDLLGALTAVTSQSTTAGRVSAFAGTWTLTQVTDGSAFDQTFNRLGRAMSAKTTANTNADVLIDTDILA